MYRLIYVALIMAATVTTNVSAQPAGKRWIFYAFLIPEKVTGCINDPISSSEELWVADEVFSKENVNEFRKQIRSKFYPKFIAERVFYVKEDDIKWIGLVEKTWKCGGKNLTYYEGKNEQEIISKAEADKKEYKEIVSYKLVKLIDCAYETTKLKQKKEKEAPSTEKSVVEADYEGLKARYTYIHKVKNPFTMVQLRNSKSNVVAVVSFNLGNNKKIQERILPGNTLSRNIENISFTVDVFFEPFKNGDNSLEVINWIKRKVREQVVSDTLNKRVILSSAGVRG